MHLHAVSLKLRRDVKLLDGKLRPVGDDASMGVGILMNSDQLAMGVLRLQPGVVKSYSETWSHDMVGTFFPSSSS